MRDADTLRRLAAIDRPEIERRVRALFELRGYGDYDRMLAMMSSNIVYEVVGAWDLHPFYGRREGIESVRQMLVALDRDFANLASIIHDVLIDGENVAVRRTARLQHRGTNAKGDVGIVDFLRFREGLLIEVSEYPDTAMIGRLSGRFE